MVLATTSKELVRGGKREEGVCVCVCVRWREGVGERECTESIGGVNWSLVLQYFGRSTAVRSSRMKKPTTMATISIIFILNQARRALEREREVVLIVVGFFILGDSTAIDLPKYCNNRLQLTTNFRLA